MRLSAFQDAWVAALWADDPRTALPDSDIASAVRHPGFSVYRNTVTKGCIDALQANYPTVLALVGVDWFRAAARLYARDQPPRDARLLLYGSDFPAFLEAFGPAAALPYLGDVARLDRCWAESHLAADAPTLEPAWLAVQDPQQLAEQVLAPHPAARWHYSRAHPAFALWRAHREAQPLPHKGPWQGDCGLLTRPQGAVQWTALPAAGAAFLDACAQGVPLQGAALAALAQEPAVDLRALMALLLRTGALSA